MSRRDRAPPSLFCRRSTLPSPTRRQRLHRIWSGHVFNKCSLITQNPIKIASLQHRKTRELEIHSRQTGFTGSYIRSVAIREPLYARAGALARGTCRGQVQRGGLAQCLASTSTTSLSQSPREGASSRTRAVRATPSLWNARQARVCSCATEYTWTSE